MAETILFKLVAQDAGVNAAIVSNREEIKKLNKEIANAKGANGYTDLVRQLTDAKIKASELKAEQRALNKEFQATQVPKDSLAGLRLEYSKLTDQITKLSAAERNSDFGKGLVSSASRVKKEIGGIEESLGRFTGNVGNYKSAISGVFGLFAAAGVSFGVGEIIQATRETEKLFAVLTNAVGSRSGATRIFAELQDFAATTPFALNEVVGAFTKLEQRNFNPNIEQLKTLGDIAAASGKSLDQFVEAVLDAQTGEFVRLKEFGIVARKSGDELNLSFKGQTTTIKNTSESITEYLLGLGKLPGIQGATDAVAKTLDGSLSNLADNFSRLFATIGSGGGLFQGIVDGFSNIIGTVNEFLSVPLSASLAIEQNEFEALIGVLKDTTVSQETLSAARNELTAKFPEYIGNIDLEKATQNELNTVLDTGNALFLKRILIESQKEDTLEFAKKELSLQKQLLETEKQISSQKGNNAFGSDITGGGLAGQRLKIQQDLRALRAEQQKRTSDAEELSQRLFGEQLVVPTIDLSASLKEQADAAKESGKAGVGAAKEQANAYELVKKRVDELTERLQVAVTQNNTGAIPKILGDLTKAQIQLQIIDATVARIKSGAANDNRSIAQRVRNPLSDNAPAPGSDLGSDPVSAELDRAKFANAEIVDDEKRTNQELLQLQTELSDQNLDIIKKGLEKEKEAKDKALEDEKARRDEIINTSLDVVDSISNAILEVEGQRIETQKETAITALDEEYKKRLDAAQGNTVLQEKIQKEYEAKKIIIEKKAAKQRQDLAIKEAVVQGALAVIKALATGNFALAIAAGIATIAQIAIIKNQKFERGGMVKFGTFGGKPHSQGGTKGQFDDGTRVEVEKDEVFAIVNKRNAPMLRKLSAVNSFGGNGTRFFEKGGALDFRPQVALPAQSALIQVLPSQASFSDAQSAQIGEIAGREIAKILAPVMQNSIGLGLNDSNQRLQRENALLKNRTV